MVNRLFIASLATVILALVAGPVIAQDNGGWRSNWNGNSFNSSAPPPMPMPPGNDLATAMKNVSLARSALESATQNVAAVKADVRAEFDNSQQFLAARQELADARQAYEDAKAPVIAQVQADANYRALIEKRTQTEIELRGVTSRSLREELAARKLNFSAQAQLMLSEALLGNGDVQNARARLERAQQTIADLRARFNAEFASRPDILAAQKSVEMARANLDAAQAYLNGVLVARSDALTIAANNAPPNYSNPNDGYPYGYYGWSPFFGGGGFLIIGGHGGHGGHR